MAFPAGISTCVMTGTLLDDTGAPLKGHVSLTPSAPAVVSAPTMTLITVASKYVQLSPNGTFSVPLLVTGQPNVLPGNVTWSLSFVDNDPPLSLNFTVPALTTADISQYVIGVDLGPIPQYLVGYRGLTGVADDPSVNALIQNTASQTRGTLNSSFVQTSKLVISSAAPTSPTVGTVWINNS